MLTPCVGHKHMITSAKVQHSFTILIAFSNAMKTHDLVPGGAVRTHLIIEVTHYNQQIRRRVRTMCLVDHRKHEKDQQIWKWNWED